MSELGNERQAISMPEPYIVDEFVVCACRAGAHALQFTLTEWTPWMERDSPDDVDLTLGYYLNNWLGLWSRLVNAVKYVLKFGKGSSHFDETMLRVDDADRLIELLQEYKRRVEAKRQSCLIQSRKDIDET